MRALGLVAVAAVACGGSHRAAAPGPVANTDRGASPRAPAPPCPDAATLEARVRALWSVPRAAPVELTCAPGWFPRAGWAVAAVVDIAEGEAWVRSAVLAVDGDAVIAQGEAHDIPPWLRDEGGGGITYEPQDLDGDGTDELVSHGGESHGGSSYDWVAVAVVTGAAITDAGQVLTHADNGADVGGTPDEFNCDAEVVLGGAAALVATGKTSGPAPDDCVVGVQTYRLRDGALQLVR